MLLFYTIVKQYSRSCHDARLQLISFSFAQRFLWEIDLNFGGASSPTLLYMQAYGFIYREVVYFSMVLIHTSKVIFPNTIYMVLSQFEVQLMATSGGSCRDSRCRINWAVTTSTTLCSVFILIWDCVNNKQIKI